MRAKEKTLDKCFSSPIFFFIHLVVWPQPKAMSAMNMRRGESIIDARFRFTPS
jgi:hypothetical protein